MIDLSAINVVSVAPSAKRARVGGGATIADLDAATQEHGLAVTGGVISDTGVGGLTLGGGMGWLTRTLGLAIDNLVSAEVVLADGSIVRASENDHSDLFWALRGGGGAYGFIVLNISPMNPVGVQLSTPILPPGRHTRKSSSAAR